MKSTDLIKNLEQKIYHHKLLYYKGEPEISDTEYDELEEKLKKLHPESHYLKMVGSEQTPNKKIKHKSKMLSLNKTYDEQALEDWRKDYDVISLQKIDGVSCSLLYENGNLILAKTRGDGSYGEDITEKILWIDSIPKVIKEKEKIEIRGEIFCEEKKFFKLSDEMEKMGLSKPTSQRNIVAGLMGRKDRVEFSRYLDFFAFELIGLDFKEEIKKLKALEKLNFTLPPYKLHKNNKTIKTTISETAEFMAKGSYLIDGIVFSYNDLSLHKELGETAHHPRYKMAFKYQGLAKETTIEDILWSVSRNGILTPIAMVSPVELSGAKITRVTLHNFGLVRQYDLKKGDKIEIIRSGEVIPKFLRVIKSSKNKFKVPNLCPSCSKKIIEEDIRLICKNPKCPAIVKEVILNFIQKIGIEDLSSKRLDEMILKGLVTEIADLFKLKEEDFLTLDKVKEKLAKKFFDNITAAKNIDLITFLSALGISGGAYNKCEKVAYGGYNSIEKIFNISPEELMEIDSFAEKSATDFYHSLKSKFPLVKKLQKLGFIIKPIDFFAESKLTNKKICITGILSIGRSEMEAMLRKNGVQVVSSVSKNTDYLLNNDKESSSSKSKKAQTLGVQIINEKELEELLAK